VNLEDVLSILKLKAILLGRLRGGHEYKVSATSCSQYRTMTLWVANAIKATVSLQTVYLHSVYSL